MNALKDFTLVTICARMRLAPTSVLAILVSTLEQTEHHAMVCIYVIFTSSSDLYIPAKPLHNCDIVLVHFNHFYCTEI